MTAKELMELLSAFPPGTKVHFAVPSGDYWKSTIVREVTSGEKETVVQSDYHCALVVGDDGPGRKSVLVLR
jgi:hypothetical protein